MGGVYFLTSTFAAPGVFRSLDLEFVRLSPREPKAGIDPPAAPTGRDLLTTAGIRHLVGCETYWVNAMSSLTRAHPSSTRQD